MVVGEDVRDAFLAAGVHGDAVGEAIAFVGVVFIEIEAGAEVVIGSCLTVASQSFGQRCLCRPLWYEYGLCRRQIVPADQTQVQGDLDTILLHHQTDYPNKIFGVNSVSPVSDSICPLPSLQV